MWYILKIYFILFLSSKIKCFNIDTNYPVIYSDPNPDPKSSTFFGYSVLLFPSKNGNSGRLKIGSPRSSYPLGKKSKPGVVYDCPFLGKCKINEKHSWKYKGNSQNVNDSWIGGTMDIGPEYDNWVVSGFRWKYAHPLNKNQVYQLADNTIGGSEWYNLTTAKSDIITYFNDSGSALSSTLGYYLIGMAEAGFSTHITNLRQKEAKVPELILGAPGIIDWGGAVLSIRPGNGNGPFQYGITYGNFDYGYLGYSVASGYFFGEINGIYYASGSPRGNSYRGRVSIFQNNVHTAPLTGVQRGEYFGSAIAAGDLNGDGFDDLVVGAPFHKIKDYNEGKVYIFFGGQTQLLLKEEKTGSMRNSQFGTTIMFIGDIDDDHCQDLAIAAPFEDDDRGAIYIYRGSNSGPIALSQKISGRGVFEGLRGFGISISRPADVDNNGYKDIAVGSHLSGHVVVLRSYPIVKIKSTLTAFSTTLQRTDNKVVFQACFSILSKTPSIKISRELFIESGSGILNSLYTANLSLKRRKQLCDNITVKLNNTWTVGYLQAIVAKLSYKIENFVGTKTELIITKDTALDKIDDGFCKSCPIIANVQAITKMVSFVANTDEDSNCAARLEVIWYFPDLSQKSFTLGSNRSLKLNLEIKNHGRTTYNPQVQIILPENVDLRQRSTNCQASGASILVCNVGNSMNTNEKKTLSLDLNMDKINSYWIDSDKLNFSVKALTCGINVGHNTDEIFSLELTSDADVSISGESLEQSYLFGKSDNEAIIKDQIFSQTYKVEKTGVSAVQSVRIIIQVPYALQTKNNGTITLMKLYKPEGSLKGQPFSCESDLMYISSIEKIDVTNTDGDIQTENIINQINVTRIKRQITENSTESDLKEDERQLLIPSNITIYINCSNPEVICSNISCTTGSIEMLQDQAEVDLKMVLDVPKSIVQANKYVVFTTYAIVSISGQTAFNQSGQRSDFAAVHSIFINESQFGIELAKLASWILITSVTIGIILLILITLGLCKVGFFKRKTKEQLKMLKAEAEAEDQTIPEMDPDIEPMDMEELHNCPSISTEVLTESGTKI